MTPADLLLPDPSIDERAALGCVLLEPERLADLADLEPRDFYQDKHRLIFEAMRAVTERGDRPDLDGLRAYLESTGDLDRCGSVAYLAGLDADLPDTAKTATYVARVKDARIRRDLEDTGKALAEVAKSGRDPSEAEARVLAVIGERVAGIWPEPEPMPEAAEPEPLPRVLLPEAFAAYSFDEAERMSAPVEFVAVPLLVSLGAVLGRRVALAPKARDPWHELANLWGAIVGPPGSSKSPAQDAGLRFVRQLEQATEDAWATGKSLDVAARVEALRLQVAAAEKLAKGDTDAHDAGRELAELKAELAEAEQRQKHGAARLTTGDATFERLAELLAANPRGLLQVRDELSAWLLTLEKQGRQGERESWLELWDGKQPIKQDRIARGLTSAPPSCVSIIGGIQPGKLAKYVEQAAGGGFGADGFLQRFGLLVYPAVPDFVHVDREADGGAADRVVRIFEHLDRVDVGARIGGEAIFADAPPLLRFSPEAQPLATQWLDEIGRAARSEGRDGSELTAAMVGKQRKTFAALALILHAVEVADAIAEPGPVGLACAERAAEWCALLTAHALKAFGRHAATPAETRAAALATKIKAGAVDDGETLREIGRRQWAELRSPEHLRDAVEALTVLGWCRVETRSPGPQGGRPTEVLRINPRVRWLP